MTRSDAFEDRVKASVYMESEELAAVRQLAALDRRTASSWIRGLIVDRLAAVGMDVSE